jgi:hypothetical protein
MISLSRSARLAAVLSILLVALSSVPARADFAPRWSTSELVKQADVIVTGHVADVAAGWDGDTIYTYVTLDLTAVLKGWVPERQIIIKQLGGRVDDLALLVAGQPSFTRGQDVLVFLEARPRDHSLSVTAQWQGQWAIQTDAVSGRPIATRRVPGTSDRQAFGAGVDAESLSVLIGEVRRLVDSRSLAPSASKAAVVVSPRDARLATPVLAVDASAFMRPLADNSRSRPVRTGCFSRFDTGGLVVSVNDPCEELSPHGGTLAISGVWVNTATAPGGPDGFMRVVQGGFSVNGGPIAHEYLEVPACFDQVKAHELAHAIGQISEASGAMQPFLDRACLRSGQDPILAGVPRSGGRLSIAGSTTTAVAAAAVTVQTARITVTPAAAQANGPSGSPSISADGRYIAFLSRAPNLTGGSASVSSILIRDNQTGHFASVGENVPNTIARITADGRYVVFHQAGRPRNTVTVYERVSGTSSIITVPDDSLSTDVLSVSDDLRYVAYLAGGAPIPARSGFVLDRQTGATTRIPSDTVGVSALLLSPDGRLVAYTIPTGGGMFVLDRQTGRNTRVSDSGQFAVTFSVDDSVLLMNYGLFDLASERPLLLPTAGFANSLAMSSSGAFVAYVPAGVSPSPIHVFDRSTGQTVRASVSTGGTAADGSSSSPSMASSGIVTYQSSATNLVRDDTNAADDVFIAKGGLDAGLPAEPLSLAATVTRVGTAATVTLTWNAPTRPQVRRRQTTSFKPDPDRGAPTLPPFSRAPSARSSPRP